MLSTLSARPNAPERDGRGGTVRPTQASVWGGNIPALDGLRGVAILLVMGVHLTVMDSRTLLDQIFYYGAFLGWIGVDLFFVLSGYLITSILYDAKGSPRYFRNFYARRTLRIFPLYYPIVFIALVVLPLWPQVAAHVTGPQELEHQWSYWLYLSNFAVAIEKQFGGGMLTVAWSLAIEEQFYLVWAPVVHRLARSTIVRLCVAMIAVAFVLRVVLLSFDVHPATLYVLTITRMDALALGALIAMLVRSESGLAVVSRWARVLAPACLLAVAAIAVWDSDPTWRGAATQSIGYTLIALTFGSLLVLTLTSPDRSPLVALMSNRHLRTVGKYSYALFLLHLPIRVLVRDHVFSPEVSRPSSDRSFPDSCCSTWWRRLRRRRSRGSAGICWRSTSCGSRSTSRWGRRWRRDGAPRCEGPRGLSRSASIVRDSTAVGCGAGGAGRRPWTAGR